MSAKKKELSYPEEQHSLIITDTFKGQDNNEIKRLSTKNNCELVIVPHNLTNKFQALDIKVSFKLSELNPLQTKWIIDMHNDLRKQNDFIIKDFDAEGITEAIKFANDVFTRVENPFDKHRQQPL